MANASGQDAARERRTAPRPPRRLAPKARREQLVAAAMPVVAEQGLDRFSLEEIADRADVTRNLLYHYFPRGRRDIVIACGERAGHEITGGWVTDEAIPLEQRMVANFVHLAGHANQPTDAWRIFRRARAADDPEYNRIIERFQDVLISTVSLNQLGTSNPPLTVQVALKA